MLFGGYNMVTSKFNMIEMYC